MNVWSHVLDSCPGLLCCVLNLHGKLIYATQGYKAVALRLFGHKCENGRNYPPLGSFMDNVFHEALTAACLGKINGFEITEGDRIWDVTASPLKLDEKEISGIVIRLSSTEIKIQTKTEVKEVVKEIIKEIPAKITQHTLRTALKDYFAVINNLSFKALLVDLKGKILAVNKKFSSDFKMDITGMNVNVLIDTSINKEQDLRGNLHTIISNSSGEIEVLMPEMLNNDEVKFNKELYLDEELTSHSTAPKILPERDFIRVKIHASPFEYETQKITLLIFEDVTESQRNKEQLHRVLSMENSLGILNRYGCEHFIMREMRFALRDKTPLSLLILNLDKFKSINEHKGYAYGNKILKNFANVLRENFILSGKNIIGRWSSDEFIVLTKKSGIEARLLANEIHKNAMTLEETLTLSIGIAEFHEESGMSLHDFVARAYDAMISAKKSGGNKTVFAGLSE